AQAAEGLDIVCDDQAVRGYPFRMGLFCDDFALRNTLTGLVVEAGALRSAAQVYEPRKIVVELDAPVSITPANGAEPMLLDYVLGRAVIEARAPGSRAYSVEFERGVFTASDGQLEVRADRLTGFSREVETGVDAALFAQGAQVQGEGLTGLSLPPLDVDFDAKIEGARFDTQSPRGLSGTLRRLAIKLTEDRGAIITGPFDVDADGLVNATLMMRIVDVDGVLEAVNAVSANAGSALGGILALQPRSGENGDEVELTVTVRDGEARLGFIPLGQIPPL
ncbi:MAG: DUF2125 domain-containing protein, partial [Pseudomonadota bacterium]